MQVLFLLCPLPCTPSFMLRPRSGHPGPCQTMGSPRSPQDGRHGRPGDTRPGSWWLSMDVVATLINLVAVAQRAGPRAGLLGQHMVTRGHTFYTSSSPANKQQQQSICPSFCEECLRRVGVQGWRAENANTELNQQGGPDPSTLGG